MGRISEVGGRQLIPMTSPAQRIIVGITLVLLALGIPFKAWLRETDARQRTTYAVCGNFDTIYVHDAHWNQEQRTTRVRKIPVTCEDTTR